MNGILLGVAIIAALTGIVLAVVSLRRQQRITRELQVSRERYRLVAEGANDGIWDYDLATRRIYFSPRVREMLGYDETELAGADDLRRIVLPEDYETARAALYGHLEQGRRDELRRVMRMRTRDGRVLTILARSVAQYAADGTPVRVAGSYTDITEQIGHERQLQIAASVFESGSDGIVISDAHDRILSVNRAFLGMTGYTQEELTGRLLRDVQIDSDAVRAREQALRDGGSWSGEVAWRLHNGETKTLGTSTEAVRDALGEVIFRIHVCIDTAELRYAQARIRHLAYFDSLTGLPNRTHLRGQFEQALATARYAGQPIAVVFFDLDNFKRVNDTHGHRVGSNTLRAIGTILETFTRKTDRAVRYGGD
ncbi:MAG TPA: PAS domain S-box protein, partial [Rhodanobacteraceae bacterium]|nr:PAS domain S-box protein [Rhodanobacteraceae bacterium]